MKKIIATLIVLTAVASTNAQAKKQQPKKPKPAETIIRTTNKDTMYFDLDNTVLISQKNKTDYYITTTNGTITKIAANFFQVGDLKENTVTISVYETKTKKLIETKKFVVAKQELPF